MVHYHEHVIIKHVTFYFVIHGLKVNVPVIPVSQKTG